MYYIDKEKIRDPIMEEKLDKEKLSKFNAEVLSTMPDEPYLGPVPSFGGRRRKTSAADWCFRALRLSWPVFSFGHSSDRSL